MNIVDAILILAILLCGVLGYKDGFIKSVVSALGITIVIRDIVVFFSGESGARDSA